MADQEENPGWESENSIEEGQQELPEFYSKTLIIIFSILFSPIFAAVLLFSNLRSIGKKKEAVYVLIFGIVYLILTALTIQALNLDPGLTPVANVIGAAILNEFFWNKFIGKYVTYKRKSWIKPTLYSLLVVMGLFFLLMGGM